MVFWFWRTLRLSGVRRRGVDVGVGVGVGVERVLSL